nr:MAG TPA: MRG/MORF4L-binding protein [Caudoviricetes sp.]
MSEIWKTLYAYYDLEVSSYGRFRKIATASGW